MNEAGAIELPAPRPDKGWSRSKWFTAIILIFGAHIGLILALSDRKPLVPRRVTGAPSLQIANDDAEWIALNDPALFARPNPRDFSAGIWSRPPVVPPPSFRWTETPRWLQPAAENFGGLLGEFMQTNRFAAYRLHFKPAPRLNTPAISIEPALASHSTLQVEDDLAARLLAPPAELPDLEFASVPPASRVQILVDAGGFVVSAILLPNDNADAESRSELADRRALEIARTLRFMPAANATIGHVLFHWHTVPPAATSEANPE